MRPLEVKLAESREVIKHHFEEFKEEEMAVAWSGGKDSTLLLWLILQSHPGVPVVFNNTGVEAKETILFIRKITSTWRLNLVETKPVKSFWQCAEEYGLAKGSKTRYKPGEYPKCCYYLKERPMLEAIRENGWKCIFLGQLAMESRNRMFKAKQKGLCYHVKKINACKVHPLLYWTVDEIWDFSIKNKVPINPIYSTGIERCGCQPCTAYRTWKEEMQKQNPRMYKLIMKKMGQELLT
jgi:phosphoadenosine phosphosulfate reductase